MTAKQRFDLLKSKTILFVEDEQMNVYEMSKILTKSFKKLIVAHDGLEGLELFKQHENEIDIIVTDINMPRMCGVEMVSKIREINTNIKIIVATGHTEKERLVPITNSGISGLLIKPYNVQDMFKKIALTMVKNENNDKIITENKDLNELVTKLDNKYDKEALKVKQLNETIGSVSAILASFTEAFVLNEGEIINPTQGVIDLFNLKNDNYEINDITRSSSLHKLIIKASREKNNAKGIVNFTSIDKELITIVVPHYHALEKISKYTIYVVC